MININADALFKHPKILEREIVRIIKNHDEEFLNIKLDELEKIILYNNHNLYDLMSIRNNIKNIIKLIWKNNWEKDWDNSAIFNDDFKQICRTPIYIPYIFMDLISGIYILYLLHGDTLQLHYNASSYQAQNMGESDDEYLRRCNSEELKRKNEHIIKWEEEFNKILSISSDTIFNKTTGRGKTRKGTDGYQLFEEYGYCVYEINKKFNLPMDLVSMYASEHVNNTWTCVLTQDYELPQYCDGMILFKTILLHHIKDNIEDRELLNWVYLTSQNTIKQIPDLKNKFETYLADISIKRKLSSPQEDSSYKEKMKQAFTWIKSEIKEIYKNLKEISEIYLENNKDENNNDENNNDENNNIYLNIFINLIINEVYAIILIYKNILLVSVKSHSEIEKLHQFVLIKPAYQIGVNTWNDFNNKFKNILNEFFEDESVSEVKELWFLAIKTIFICDPNRFKLNNKFIIPKKFDDKIISKIGVSNLPARGLLATMLLLKHSHNYYVKLKDEEIIVDKNKKRKRIYHGLVSDRISTNKKTSLFKILKNWTSESDTPMLKLQVRELTREYISSCKLRDKDLLNTRRVLSLLWIVYLKAIKFSIESRLKGLNQIRITFDLNNIIQEISYKRQQI